MARHVVRVRVGEREYTVEVGRLDARPVTATIDGQTYEVWPDPATTMPAPTLPATNGASAGNGSGNGSGNGNGGAPRLDAPAAGASASAPADPIVRAPLPGAIVAVLVKPGDAVTRGQELCQIEAMKMVNVVRAPRDGRVRAVPIIVGQAVEHGGVLVQLED